MPYLSRTGTRLFYTDSGTGDPPLLFVHGWCCNSTHWRAQVAAFRRQHRVVTTDLRGHGRSDKPEQAYTMDGFADDLEWLVNELRLHRPILVGHSMGGLLALLLARRKKVPLSAIALIDPILHLALSQQQLGGMLRGLETPGYRAAKIMIDGLFRPTSARALRREIAEGLLTVPRHVMVPVITSLVAEMHPEPLDIGIPALLIDAGRSFDELKTIECVVPGIQIGRTIGAGHFNMIEAPHQVNAMLRTFIDQCGGADGRAHQDQSRSRNQKVPSASAPGRAKLPVQ